MGYYVNPPGEAKEDWLIREGVEIGIADAKEHDDFTDELLVMCVENDAFSAAAIADRPSERDYFVDDEEPRPRRCFLVDREKLMGVSDLPGDA